MTKHLVVWLDTDEEIEKSRTFDHYNQAEKFMRSLRRKFPHSPIEYKEF